MAELATSAQGNSLSLPFMDGLGRLGILKQIGLLVGLAASVALGVAVVLWTRDTPYQTLVTQPDAQAAAQIGSLLEQSHIDYRIDPDSGVIMVDGRRLEEAKLKLASSGLAPHPNPGYELLDNEPFGSSQFMETARYYRSVEGELARTISAMAGIREARVHLAIPKHSVFVGDDSHPSASVFVSQLGLSPLDRSQVAAIVHLVAASVPNMRPQDVALVDQSGHLLSSDDNDPGALLSEHQLQYQKGVETDLRRRIQEMLTPILGPGGFHVEVSADLDFNKVEQTAENFNPDLPALRSEQTVSEMQNAGSGAVGVPGALSNQPPNGGSAPATTNAASLPKTGPGAAGFGNTGGGAASASTTTSSPGSQRQESTKNFELDHMVSHVQQQVGAIKRLSVAVVVDNMFTTVKTSKGVKTQRVPLNAQQLQRLTTLIRDSVGYDVTRGDQVSVVNQPFVDMSALEATSVQESSPWWKQTWFLTLLRQVLGGLFILVLVLAVLRPIMRNLSQKSAVEVAEEEAALHELGLDGGSGGGVGEGGRVTLSGAAEDLMLPGPHDGFESQLAAVKAMIAEDPGRVAQVVKEWVNKDAS